MITTGLYFCGGLLLGAVWGLWLANYINRGDE
jgi:hypothetical protein